jgi:hypothetical protein
MKLNRRHFLAALGATGAWLGLDSDRRAQANPAEKPLGARAENGEPLRFVGVYTPHGRAHELWAPGQDFDLSYDHAVLAPFDDPSRFGKSYRSKLLVLDGVDLSAGIAVGTTGHDGPRVILTGSGADGATPSIDQYLAVEKGLGAETLHTSVVLGVGNDGSEIGANVSYSRGGTPVPKLIDPEATYAELFGAPLGAKREELDRERRLGKSVLDRVRSDLSSLKARAPASEKVKLDQHATALREIEKRLAGVPASCALPAPPDKSMFPKLRAYGGGEPYFQAITELQVDLLARAMACDLTRFATLFLADLTRSKLFPGLPEDIHGDVAHRYDARTDRHPGTPASWLALATQNRNTASHVARLLQKLDEAGVLDETIVYASGDMGDPARHSSRHVPVLIAGGCGGRFKLGRYIDMRGTGAKKDYGVPNNRVLVSLCQAFGVEENRFGHSTDQGIVTGRLEELYA